MEDALCCVYKWHRSLLLLFYWPDTVYGYSTVWEAGKCTPALFLDNRCNNKILIIDTLENKLYPYSRILSLVKRYS